MKEIILQPMRVASLEKRVSINRNLISKTIDLMNEGQINTSDAKLTIITLSNINRKLMNTIRTFYKSINSQNVGDYPVI